MEADFQKYDEVQEVLVYEQKGIIAAEIYPDEQSLIGKLNKETIQEHFDNICEKINHNRPMYKRVGMVKIRDSEFTKNTSKKIIRYNTRIDYMIEKVIDILSDFTTLDRKLITEKSGLLTDLEFICLLENKGNYIIMSNIKECDFFNMFHYIFYKIHKIKR